MTARAPKSGTRLRGNDGAIPMFPSEGELDELLVERVRVFYQRVASHLRELEAYKLKRGICVGGISCTRKGIPNRKGEPGRVCAHHTAARKAGMKLRRWQAYESEYGRLRREIMEREKEEAKAEAKKAAAKKKSRAA